MNPCNNRFPLWPATREEVDLSYSDDQTDRTLGLDRPIGRVSFVNGERMEFTAPQGYLRTIWGELSTRDATGLRFETLTDDPAVRKAADGITYDLYGEKNSGPLEDYVPRQGPEIGGQRMWPHRIGSRYCAVSWATRRTWSMAR